MGETDFTKEEVEDFKEVSILKLAQDLEDVITHEKLPEDMSVFEYLKHYFRKW